jgi:hypothetical protein
MFHHFAAVFFLPEAMEVFFLLEALDFLLMTFV